MRRVSLVLLFLAVLAPVECWAHRHVAGAFAAYRYAKRSNIDGVSVGFEIPFCKEKAGGECVDPYEFTLLLGFASIDGEHNGEKQELRAFLAGTRYFFKESHDPGVQPFIQGVFGLVRDKRGTTPAELLPTATVAVGADLTLFSPGSLDIVLTPQVEASWIIIGTPDKPVFPGFSVGLGLRF